MQSTSLVVRSPITAETRKLMSASWTPKRRAEQARRLRMIVRARNRRRGKKGVSKKPLKSGTSPALTPHVSAALYLGEALKGLRKHYQAGNEIEQWHAFVVLAHSVLTKRA